MIGRAMKLVLYIGWPCALALVVYLVGFVLGEHSLPAGRRISTTVYGKYEALSICVQSITGERGEAEAARGLVESAVSGVGLPGPRLFTLPANAPDATCPGAPAHYGASAKARRVADSPGGRGLPPSPYQLHVYLMPRITLQVLQLEPDLGDRRVVVEEYIVEGSEPNVVLSGVTFGLYATSEELADTVEFQRFFNRAFLMQSQLGATPRSRV
jgi:hypothetical protein